MKKSLLLTSLISLSAASHGVSFDDVSFWVGTGSNRAAFVLDFNDGLTPTSYLWGFRWDGEATGESMLRAIDVADSNIDFALDFFGAFGYSLNTARYLPTSQGYVHEQAFSDVSERYWSYWTSTEGSNTWGFAPSGMSQRTLQDGDVDGWAFSNTGYSAVAPTTPVAAVPEPGSLAAISLGVGAILARRKKQLALLSS